MYDAHNMYPFLGSEAQDNDAQEFASFLLARGWELALDSEGYFRAYRDGAEMTEQEWQDELAACFG